MDLQTSLTALAQYPVPPARARRCDSDPVYGAARGVPRAGLEWLGANGYLDPSGESPLTFVSQQGFRTSREQRIAAAAALFARGELRCRRRSATRVEAPARFVNVGAGGSGALERSLAILERPQARLRFGIAEPGQMATLRELYIRGGEAVHCFSDGETALIGEPVRIEQLCASLVRHLCSPDLPADMEMLCMMPQLFELTTALWQRRGKPLAVPITAVEVAALLPAEAAEGEAVLLLASMVEAGVLERAGQGPGTAGYQQYSLSERYRRWLAVVWSGYVFEIERAEVSPKVSGTHPKVSGTTPANVSGTGWYVANEKVSPKVSGTGTEGRAKVSGTAAEKVSGTGWGEGDRLLFVGPAGRRVLCQDLALEAPEAGGAAGGVMLLQRLCGAELLSRLAGLLRPVATRPVGLDPARARRPRAQTEETPPSGSGNVDIH
jgi:hypothetical protein